MATPTTQIRFSDADRARLAELGRLFGTPGKPMSMADVLRRLMWEHEAGTETRKNAKTKQT